MASTRTMGRDGATQRVWGRDGLTLDVGSLGGGDPLGFAAGDSNLYRYVGNNPINEVDPSGLISIYFDGTGQPVGANTTIQTLFAYSTDPNKILYTNPKFVDSQLARDGIVKDAVNRIVQAQAKNPGERIYLYGWSRGGYEAIATANFLAELNIRVQFVGVIDLVSNPIVIPDGMTVNNNVTWFFQAGRSGVYDPKLNVSQTDIAADGTIFQPVKVSPDYKSMSPKHQSCMNFKNYPMNHGKSGWPLWNPDIYNDLLGRARQSGAPYPVGSLPPGNKPNPPGGKVIIR